MELLNNTIIDVNGEVYNFNNKGLNNFSSDVDITNFEQVKTYVDSHYIRPSFHDGNYIANNIKIHAVKLSCKKSLAYNIYEGEELMSDFYNCNPFVDEIINHFTQLTNLNFRFLGRSNGYIVLGDKYKPYQILTDNFDEDEYYLYKGIEEYKEIYFNNAKILLLFDYYSSLFVDYFSDFCLQNSYPIGYLTDKIKSSVIKQLTKDNLLQYQKNNYIDIYIQVIQKTNKNDFEISFVNSINLCNGFGTDLSSLGNWDFSNNHLLIDTIKNIDTQILNYLQINLDYLTVIKDNN